MGETGRGIESEKNLIEKRGSDSRMGRRSNSGGFIEMVKRNSRVIIPCAAGVLLFAMILTFTGAPVEAEATQAEITKKVSRVLIIEEKRGGGPPTVVPAPPIGQRDPSRLDAIG